MAENKLNELMKELTLPGGCDFGNRNVKLSIDLLDGNGPKSVSLPAVYSTEKPLGPFDPKKQVYKAPDAFSVEFCGVECWFGRDVLGAENLFGISEIDDLKYHDFKHLRLLFKAAVKRFNEEHGGLQNRRVLISTSMPPGPYHTKPEIRSAAVLAYKKVFGRVSENGKKVLSMTATHTLGKGFNLTTTFHDLQPEGINYIYTYRNRGKKIDNKPVLVVDLGLGTCEYLYFPAGAYMPKERTGTITMPVHGLINGFDSVDRGNSELSVLRGKDDSHWPESLKSHYRHVYDFIVQYRHNLNGNKFEDIAFVGGGAMLLDRSKSTKMMFRRLGRLHIGDEFINSLGNLEKTRIACDEINSETLMKIQELEQVG